VAVRDRGTTYAEKSVVLSRFLSALSWSERGGIVSLYAGGGGSHLSASVQRLDRGQLHTATERLALQLLPEPDERGCLALALMREARSLDSKPYAFLTFYRVLELAIPNGKARGTWLEAAVPRISDCQVTEGLRDLYSRGVTDVGGHLRESGRHAVAHATGGIIVDPDDLIANARFHLELPIMEALAELAVIELLGIPES
jgi:hypothetical protein